MIEILNGMTETINYGSSLGVRLYHNVDYEDYPEHWHVGLEIIMPVSSEYTVIVGKERFRLMTGDILVINSGVVHSLLAPPTGERIIFQFDPSLLYLLKELETLMSLMPGVVHITPETEPELYGPVKTQMNRIIREYDGEKMFCGAVVYAALIEMFVEIGRTVTMRKVRGDAEEGDEEAERRGGRYLEVVMKACDYINSHYQEKLKLEDVAAIVGFSKYHFTRVFKQYKNMTFYEYLNKKRVQCAEGLLYSTDMNITDVAMNSGFSSLSAFDRTFKALNQCAPSDFRNTVRAGKDIIVGEMAETL